MFEKQFVTNLVTAGLSTQICNYEGPFRIMVTLMTEDNETHAHELVGKNCTDGVCLVYGMGNEMEIR